MLETSGLRWFFTLLRPHRARLGIASLALVLAGAISLVLPSAAGRVVDAALISKDTGQLDVVIYTLVGLFAVAGVLSFIETYLLRYTAASIILGLRSRLHAHLLGLSPSFFEAQRTGELLSRLGSDIDQIGWALTHDLVNGLQQGLVLCGALAVLVTIHARLTALMLLGVPALAVSAVVFGRRLERIARNQQAAVADATVVAEESLAGIRTVQAFAREVEEGGRYAGRLGLARALSVRAAFAWGAFGGTMMFLVFSVLAVMLWFGGRLVITGELTAGQLTAFMLYMLSVGSATSALTQLWGQLKTASGATERVRQLLAQPSVIRELAAPVALLRARGQISFEAVDFAYPTSEGRRALEGLSLDIAPGHCVAVVGPSGAGKSTLAALLLRFYDPDAGAVLLDGVDLREYRLTDLRGAIGLVPQDIFLFGGTVAENLRVGKPTATDEELRAAAEAAQALGFLERLPKGFETVLGERGIRLSVGERQRLAIARVFLKDPGIVVLDEATSSLDSESEHEVQRALERLLAGRTTIVIAHRLATVRRAHRVVLLQRGVVLAQGCHDDLLAGNDLYRHLCELQMLT